MKSNLRLLYLLILITVGTLAVWWFDFDSGNIQADASTDYSIADTSTVDKIFIADNFGQVLLERVPGERLWTVNGGMNARKSSIDLLLKTFKRVAVKGAVPEMQRETVIRNLAGAAKKVEIYTGGDKPAKTWYVGTATPNHTGTYMLLETPEGGKSSEPFIMHLEGFTGYLTTRFFTDLDEWRYTGIFEYPNRSLKSVKFADYDAPINSFKMTAEDSGKLKLESLTGAEVPYLDTLAVQNQFIKYNKVHFESWNNRLTEAAQDSIRSLQAKYSIECESVDGEVAKVDLFEKDEEHMYGIADDGHIVLVQTYVFDPLTGGLRSFLR